MYFKISAVFSILLMGQAFGNTFQKQTQNEEECITETQIWQQLLAYLPWSDFNGCENVPASLDDLITIITIDCQNKFYAAALDKSVEPCNTALRSAASHYALLIENLQNYKAAVEKGDHEEIKKYIDNILVHLRQIQEFTAQAKKGCKDGKVTRISDICQLAALKGGVEVIYQAVTCPIKTHIY